MSSSPLSRFDDIVRQALQRGTAKYAGNSTNILELRVEEGSTEQTIYVGHVTALLSHSKYGNPYDITDAIAVAVAVQDFNNRYSRFPNHAESHPDSGLKGYPNVTELTRGCNFYMTMTTRDTGRNLYTTGKAWQEAFFDKESGNSTVPRPFAVVGPRSSQLSATASILGAITPQGSNDDDPGVINISGASSAAFLDNTILYPYFARTAIPSARFVPDALMYHLNNIGVRQVAILHVETQFALDTTHELLKAASHYPSLDVLVVGFVDRDQESMASAAALLKDMEMIYHIGIQLDRDMILNLIDAGMMGNNSTNWILNGASVSSMLFNYETNLEDQKIHQALHQTQYSTMLINTNLKDAERHNQKLLDTEYLAYLNDTDNTKRDYLLSKYVGQGNIYAQNHSLYQDQIDFAMTWKARAWRRSIRTYDATMALGIAACQEDNMVNFSTRRHYQRLKNLQFTGASLDVAFDARGSRTPDGFVASLYNMYLVESSDSNATKVEWNASTLIRKSNTAPGGFETLTEVPLVYKGGSTTPPLSMSSIEEKKNLVPQGIQAICWLMAIFVVLSSVFCLVWTVATRERSKLRASQPIFMGMLSVGTLLMGLSIIPGTWQEPMPSQVLDVGCMLHVWLLSIGFSTTFAALFAKTWRINRLYANARAMRRSQVLVSHVFWVPLSVFLLNTSVLAVWTAVSPLEWNRITLEVDAFGRTLESKGTCLGNDQTRTNTVFGVLVILINFFSFLINGFQSYKARELPSSFNESFYITVCNSVILEVFLIGTPLLSVLSVNSSASMLVGSWITATTAFAVLVPMFGPKILDKNKDGRVSMAKSSKTSHTLTREPSEDHRMSVEMGSQYILRRKN